MSGERTKVEANLALPLVVLEGGLEFVNTASNSPSHVARHPQVALETHAVATS